MAKIKLGKPQVNMATSARTPGTMQGNALGSYDKMTGHNPDGTSTAARSTGINPNTHGPIDPSMPNLSPA